MVYAIITDIHEDIDSLEKVILKIETLKSDKILCLGDIIGFSMPFHRSFIKSKSASDCLALIKSKCSSVVIGNHDLNSIFKLPITTSFKYPSNWSELTINEKRDMSNNEIYLYEDEFLSDLSNEDQVFLNKLKEETILDKMLFTHFLYPNITGSQKIFTNHLDLIKQHFYYMNEKQCRISFVGHLHYFGMQIISTKEIINAKEKQDYYLDSNDSYIIICPPIVRSEKTKPSFVIYDSDTRVISWYSA